MIMEERFTLKLFTSMNFFDSSLSIISLRLNTSAAQYNEISIEAIAMSGSPVLRRKWYIHVLFIGFSSRWCLAAYLPIHSARQLMVRMHVSCIIHHIRSCTLNSV